MNDYIGLTANDMGFDAHLTVMYFGTLDKDRANYINEMVGMTLHGFSTVAHRKEIKQFNPTTSVVTVDFPNHLHLIALLEKYGISSVSGFPWNPHITLKFEEGHTMRIPERIYLDRPYLKFDGKKNYF